jgi:hypothetical protein
MSSEKDFDDAAIDAFAAAMKEKMDISRGKGRGGWETCSRTDLWQMLKEHVTKGDPIDVANLAMMLWNKTNFDKTSQQH